MMQITKDHFGEKPNNTILMNGASNGELVGFSLAEEKRVTNGELYKTEM